MFKKIPSIFNKETLPTLSELDPLFENAISGPPKELQIEYCKRAISSALFDLQHNVCLEKEKV